MYCTTVRVAVYYKVYIMFLGILLMIHAVIYRDGKHEPDASVAHNVQGLNFNASTLFHTNK